MTIKQWPQHLKLAAWQLDFAEKYLEHHKPRSLLVAGPGTGKTFAALYTAHQMRKQNLSELLIVVNDLTLLREQWKSVASEVGFSLSETIDLYRETENDGLSITVQSLKSNESVRAFLELAKNSKCFVIVDESHRSNRAINEVVDECIRINDANRVLFITRSAQDTFDARFRFDTEYIFQDSIVKLRETRIEVAHFSPSFSVLERLVRKHVQIDDLTWREFEKLISELLEQDGYEVELMRGTKDGGVDVVAVKNIAEAGSFKTLWQAKKKKVKNKVGLSLIRELADTTNEFKASKGIIVTSTYLTTGALARIQRDKYILGKVDRNDLNAWIQRTLLGTAMSSCACDGKL